MYSANFNLLVLCDVGAQALKALRCLLSPPTQAFLGELVFHPSPQTAFVGRDEKRALLKTPAWEASFFYAPLPTYNSYMHSCIVIYFG